MASAVRVKRQTKSNPYVSMTEKEVLAKLERSREQGMYRNEQKNVPAYSSQAYHPPLISRPFLNERSRGKSRWLPFRHWHNVWHRPGRYPGFGGRPGRVKAWTCAGNKGKIVKYSEKIVKF